MQFKWMSPIIVVLAFVLAVGIVAAQDDAEATPETPTSESAPFLGMHRGGFGGGFGMDIVTLTDATGLTAAEIRSALADGSTIAELIEANGGDVDALIADAVAEYGAYLAVAVEYERMTQEEADAQLAQFEEHLTARVNGELEAPFMDGFGGRGGFGQRGGFGFDLATLTDATGLNEAEIRSALADGSTIAELVEANGGDLDALIAEVVSTFEERLATAVENGRLTQEEADARLAEFETNVSAWANGELEAPFMQGFGGRGGRGGRGR